MRSMRATVMLLIIVGLMATLAYGASDASSSTTSHLISYDTVISTVRTISDNSVSTPDLSLKGQGEVNSNIKLASPSTAEIKQGLSLDGIRNGNYGGSASFYSSIFGENVLSASSVISGTSIVEVGSPFEFRMVESTSSGLCLANPGSSNYDLSLTGGQSTVTNAALQSVPEGSRPPGTKVVSISLDLYPLDLEVPADSLVQDVKLDFELVNNDLAAYSFDFSRNLDIGDISCQSGMGLIHLN